MVLVRWLLYAAALVLTSAQPATEAPKNSKWDDVDFTLNPSIRINTGTEESVLLVNCSIRKVFRSERGILGSCPTRMLPPICKSPIGNFPTEKVTKQKLNKAYVVTDDKNKDLLTLQEASSWVQNLDDQHVRDMKEAVKNKWPLPKYYINGRLVRYSINGCNGPEGRRQPSSQIALSLSEEQTDSPHSEDFMVVPISPPPLPVSVIPVSTTPAYYPLPLPSRNYPPPPPSRYYLPSPPPAQYPKRPSTSCQSPPPQAPPPYPPHQSVHVLTYTGNLPPPMMWDSSLMIFLEDLMDELLDEGLAEDSLDESAITHQKPTSPSESPLRPPLPPRPLLSAFLPPPPLSFIPTPPPPPPNEGHYYRAPGFKDAGENHSQIKPDLPLVWKRELQEFQPTQQANSTNAYSNPANNNQNRPGPEARKDKLNRPI